MDSLSAGGRWPDWEWKEVLGEEETHNKDCYDGIPVYHSAMFDCYTI